MLHIARTISQLALLEQFGDAKKSSHDFKAWIATQNYFIDNDISSSSFSLRVVDSTFAKSLANDCDRFTRANLETICSIQTIKVFQKSSAWPIISAYYASFFAAHAFLRIFGISYSSLTHDHLKKIVEQAKLFGKDAGHNSINSGYYKCTFDKATSVITCDKMEDSHADLWVCFLSLVKKLINDLPNVSAISQDKLDSMELLSNIKTIITQKNGSRGNWLSIIRNSVNYQGSHGSWYPYADLDFDGSGLKLKPKTLLSNNHSKIIASTQSDLNNVFNTSLRLSNLLIALVKECNSKFSNANYAFKNGSLKMINMIEV